MPLTSQQQIKERKERKNVEGNERYSDNLKATSAHHVYLYILAIATDALFTNVRIAYCSNWCQSLVSPSDINLSTLVLTIFVTVAIRIVYRTTSLIQRSWVVRWRSPGWQRVGKAPGLIINLNNPIFELAKNGAYVRQFVDWVVGELQARGRGET